MKKVWAVTLAAALVVMHPLAEAKRMGGGGSFGKQSSNVTQRQATPPAAPPATPCAAANAQQSNAAAKPATPAPAAPPRSLGAPCWAVWQRVWAWRGWPIRWALGEAFANMLLFGLLALVVMVVIGAIMRARANKKPAAARPAASPFAFQGAGAPVPPAEVATPPQYKSHNVGNDASARPWGANSRRHRLHDRLGHGRCGSPVGGACRASMPRVFWMPPSATFVTLQAAWDKGDIATLRAMMTDDMLAEIKQQLEEREAQSAGAPNQTDVVMIDGHLLGIEDLGDSYMASVEFSGLIREEPSAGPSPFP